MNNINVIKAVLNLTSNTLSTNNGIGYLVKYQIDLKSIFQLYVVDNLNALNISTLSNLQEDVISLFLNENGNPLSIHLNEVKFCDKESDLININKVLDSFLERKINNHFNSLFLLGSGVIFLKDLEIIKLLINEKLNCDVQTIEFKYINNIPGIILYIPLNNSSNNEQALNKNINEYELNINLMNQSKTNQKRTRIELPLNTYAKVLTMKYNEIKNSNRIIQVKDLMQDFEELVKIELKNQYNLLLSKGQEKGESLSSFIDRNLEIFGTKGNSGAKRAQILMRITNEPTRVHFFQNKKRDDFNMFTYCKGFENIKFFERDLMIYDVNDDYIKTQPVYPEK